MQFQVVAKFVGITSTCAYPLKSALGHIPLFNVNGSVCSVTAGASTWRATPLESDISCLCCCANEIASYPLALMCTPLARCAPRRPRLQAGSTCLEFGVFCVVRDSALPKTARVGVFLHVARVCGVTCANTATFTLPPALSRTPLRIVIVLKVPPMGACT